MSVIPPSPSKTDYTQSSDYIACAKANEAPIFNRTDPIALFTDWMTEARAAELNDSNAMALATADSFGLPDVRMVLLKDVDERGFVFYTNGESDKAEQLKANQNAALCFHWKSLRRQVRVRGPVRPVDSAEADAYFASRARGSQLGAWSSDQSRPIDSLAALESKVSETEARFEGRDIERPPHWYGWRVMPMRIEFWRDRPFRLHDRLVFERDDLSADWTRSRLQP